MPSTPYNKFLQWVIPPMIAATLAASIAMVRGYYALSESVAVIRTEMGSFTQLKKDVSTALMVLSQHGEEFKDMRAEQLRLRSVYDDLHSKIDSKTFDRFTGKDADNLRLWIDERFSQRKEVTDLQHEAILNELTN